MIFYTKLIIKTSDNKYFNGIIKITKLIEVKIHKAIKKIILITYINGSLIDNLKIFTLIKAIFLINKNKILKIQN